MPEPRGNPASQPSRDAATPTGEPVNRGEIILDDRACVSCGYSLKGIPASGKCPECGHLVRRSVKSSRFDDSLVNAPLSWLRALSSGAYILAFSGFGALIGYLALAFSPGPPLSALVLMLVVGSAAGWWVGVWMCTRPRPVTGSTSVSPEREWGRLRLVARITQAGWGVAVMIAVVQAVMSPVGMLDQLMTGFVGLAVLGALGGHMALCLYLSRLADWANDSGLANHFKSASYLVLGVIVSNGLMLLAPFLGFFVVLFSVLMFLVSLAAVVHFYVGLWQFASMTRWAVINNASASARDQRLRERAERARRIEAEPSVAGPAGSRTSSARQSEEYVAKELPSLPMASGASAKAKAAQRDGSPPGGGSSAPQAAVSPPDPRTQPVSAPKPKWERDRPSDKPIDQADIYNLAPDDHEKRV